MNAYVERTTLLSYLKKENILDLYLSSQRAWPVGKYKVEVYLNDVLDRTLEFSVQAAV